MIKEFFNARAAIWDEEVAEKDTSKLKALATRLDIKPGATVLDVGTGTGIFLPFLLKMSGKKGKIVALDIAEKMLIQAQTKGFGGKITFLCANVEDIPLPPETCDAVVCYSSFPHFQNKPKALREIRRVLKNGSCVFICHTSSREAINDIHMGIPLLHHDLLPDSTTMEKLLRTAGFTGIVVEDTADSYFATARKEK